jgi:hypothetical protein
VTITSPVAGDIVTTDTFTVSWQTSHGSCPTVIVDVLFGGSSVRVTETNTPSAGELVIDTRTVPLWDGTDYKVTVQLSEGNATVSDESGVFTIDRAGDNYGTTARYSGDGGTNAFFSSYCTACHGPDVSIRGYRFDAYDDTDGSPGVYSLRSSVADAVDALRMPQGAPAPTQDERDALVEWASGGAPR